MCAIGRIIVSFQTSNPPLDAENSETQKHSW